MRFPLLIVTVALFGAGGAGQGQQPPDATEPRNQPPASLHPQPVTALFRRLLAASAEEQNQILARKPPQTREVLVLKLEEYRDLPAIERERRLRLLDLRWYITQLRNLAPSNRLSLLQTVPTADRRMVEERLAVWDALSNDQKEQVWLYDITKTYLIAPPLPPSPPSLTQPNPLRAPLEQAARRWRELPAEKQADIAQNFQRIFEDEPPMPPGLSPTERTQLKNTLLSLKQLQPSQREKAFEGVKRFAALTTAERERFIENANRWNQFTPEQRNALRTLTEHLPPLPPDFYNPPLPPLGLSTAETNQRPGL